MRHLFWNFLGVSLLGSNLAFSQEALFTMDAIAWPPHMASFTLRVKKIVLHKVHPHKQPLLPKEVIPQLQQSAKHPKDPKWEALKEAGDEEQIYELFDTLAADDSEVFDHLASQRDQDAAAYPEDSAAFLMDPTQSEPNADEVILDAHDGHVLITFRHDGVFYGDNRAQFKVAFGTYDRITFSYEQIGSLKGCDDEQTTCTQADWHMLHEGEMPQISSKQGALAEIPFVIDRFSDQGIFTPPRTVVIAFTSPFSLNQKGDRLLMQFDFSRFIAWDSRFEPKIPFGNGLVVTALKRPL